MHRHQREKQMMKRLRLIHSQRKRQTADDAMPRVQVGGSSGSGSAAGHEELHRRHRSVSSKCKEVRKVQGVSLDTDKRELQRLARNSVEYYFRDKQVEASDALIDEVGALLTESGGAQIIETFSPDRFAAKAGGFCN